MHDHFDSAAYRDASTTWDVFTRTWNWAASLAVALPVVEPGIAPLGRPVDGGFWVSGRRHPTSNRQPDWVALSMVPARQATERTAHGARGRMRSLRHVRQGAVAVRTDWNPRVGGSPRTGRCACTCRTDHQSGGRAPQGERRGLPRCRRHGHGSGGGPAPHLCAGPPVRRRPARRRPCGRSGRLDARRAHSPQADAVRLERRTPQPPHVWPRSGPVPPTKEPSRSSGRKATHFDLMGVPGASLDQVECVRGHVHALRQCRKVLREGGWGALVSDDTAGAAR